MAGDRFLIPAGDVEAFAIATGDTNPLHTDPTYARRTPFGSPIAHGALATLHALAGLPSQPENQGPVRLSARFAAPVYPDQEYVRSVVATGESQYEIEVRDGASRVLQVVVEVGPLAVPEAPVPGGAAGRPAPATLSIEEIHSAARLEVPCAADIAALEALLSRIGAGVTVRHAVLLGWASYLAGMELPGRASLISVLEVDFSAPGRAGDHGSATVDSVDLRFGLLRLSGVLPGAGTVQLRVLVRSEPPAPDPVAVRALLPSGEPLTGKVAVVIGGSRGLGASLVHALAAQGATVYLTYRSSVDEAETIRAAFGDRVRPVAGDAADPDWCARLAQRVRDEHGRLDALVLNAFPPTTALSLDPATVGRAAAYLSAGLALARSPLAALGPVLAESAGRVVAISSAWASEPPAGWSHYVSAKLAIEGLIRAAAADLPAVSFLIARPPRMRTAFSSSAFGTSDALPVEPVAATIVNRLSQPAADAVETLSEFSTVDSRPRLVVAGTFTLDPLADELQSTVDSLGLALEVTLAGYGQVFQELLDPASTFAANTSGCNAILLRPADWPAAEAARIEGDLVAAIEAFAGRSRVPLLVLPCPAEDGPAAVPGLADRLAGLPGVYLIEPDRWHGGLPVEGYLDPARQRLAHIPYRPAGYAALAAGLARAAHAVLAPPFKVLMLDCDNTLWRGVCGEDGPDGVQLTEGYRRLQEWAAGLAGQGVLVCLVSKNSPETVAEVFARRPEFPLRPEHVTASRIGWNPKPDGIAGLAAELGLGLDSVVFLDDNPVEVAAVRAALPEVLALRVPDDPDRIVGFLDRLWALDRFRVTAEDRRRTEFYRSRQQRAESRREAVSFADFIADLGLHVDIRPATGDLLARAAQLTQRTNQFNFSTVRRQEPELAALLGEGGVDCWVVDAGDRFGDYGTVGVAITRTQAGVVDVDTFLLSCRALGRGVEHGMLAHLGRVAASAGTTTMRIRYRPTPRNEPARRFLDETLSRWARSEPDGSVIYEVPVDEVARVAFQPTETEPPEENGDREPVAGERQPTAHGTRLAGLAAIAEREPARVEATPVLAGTATASSQDLVAEVFARVLSVPQTILTADTRMDQLRPSSLSLVDATVELERYFGELPATLLFEHRTLGSLASWLDARSRPAEALPAPAPVSTEPAAEAVAVIGLAGRYPGARNVRELWEILRSGRDSVGQIPAERWDHEPYYDPDGGPGKTYSRWAGLIDGVDEFDPLFFHIPPSEAELMDPQQRLFLEIAYEVLADAGYTPASLGRDVGVYVGAMAHDYGLFSAAAATTGESPYPWSENYQIANRVSYLFDFTGPSLAVDTACSASGSALYLAWEAVRRGAVAAAIAGGVNLVLHPARHIQYAQMGMLSRVGHCAAFGAGADGFVIGEGVGAVLLKPLSHALRDRDHVYGVLIGAAMNSDGRTNGFTVPSPVAQADLIRRALAASTVDPATIGYVEAHGSGTPLGDPIEVRGLTEAFGPGRPANACGLGSVKGNIGHLESAAAIAGLTKVLLQLTHRTLVPTLHAKPANPRLDLSGSPFRIQRETAPWTSSGPRRAGLSSFGAGGVNVHFVVEEAPAPAPEPAPGGDELIRLSARGTRELAQYAARLREYLTGEGADLRLADIAYTMRVGREQLDQWVAFTVEDREGLLRALAVLADGGVPEGAARGGAPHPMPGYPDSNRTGRRVSLPVPPFARTRHWLASARPVESEAAVLYRPEWTPAVEAPALTEPVTVLVVGADPDALDRTGVPASATVVTAGPDLDVPVSGPRAIVVDYRLLESEWSVDDVLDPLWALARVARGGRRIDYVALTRLDDEDPVGAAVVGFGRSAELEGLPLRCTRIQAAAGQQPVLGTVLSTVASGEREVRYDSAGRWVRRFQPVPTTGPDRLRDGGGYLITGGAGGVGRLVARELAQRYHAKVVLIGRSPLSEDIERVLAELRALGGDGRYLTADVTERSSLAAAVQAARDWTGGLHGIIHAAGVIDDSGLATKHLDSARRVLAPKTTGAVLLDAVTATDRLDFFVLMSSYVGTLGNAGQADYAAANRFLDAFAEWRRQHRPGVSVSIVWPLWAEGGMRMPSEVERLTASTTGLRPIGTAAALTALRRAIGTAGGTVLVGHGDVARFSAALNGSTAGPQLEGSTVEERLAGVLAGLLKLSPEEVDPERSFGEYGVDSVLTIQLANRINETFDLSIGTALLYDRPTIRSLATSLRQRRPSTSEAVIRSEPPQGPEPIAVVGMAARLPGSPDLAAFWANLMAGRDLVGPAPAGRELPGVRGGFLDDVEGFDGGLFRISPREAHLMDPQQRLFLEACWHALEDSGRDPRSLAGSRVGVFAGVTLADYLELLTRDGTPTSGHLVTGNVHSIVANRVSYLLDLRGPSEAVDAACASSLVALHRACTALRAGECDLALAGGVNVLLSPTWFTTLTAAGMLSATGRCATFDRSADGYARGEGVGAVVLKPLSRAIADGDRIHGLILGSAVNHGGQAHSLTAPRPSGQAEVIRAALRAARVPANGLSYVETHGTGTELGDPIEVAGLTEAFADSPPAPCAIGTVKASIGHLESAAGIAGLVTVLLAMRYRTLPGNPHFAELNPHIDLDAGRFRVVQRAEPWPVTDGPRRAGLSSFGFGGSNAHVVVEEPPAPEASVPPASPRQVVVLSARDRVRLREYAQKLLDHIGPEPVSLPDLAYTSQVGRTPMAVRLAVVCRDTEELRTGLRDYLAGRSAENVYHRANELERAPGDGLAEAASQWVSGVDVDWTRWHEGPRRRVDFPLYPFDHSRRYGVPGGPEPALVARRWVPAPAMPAAAVPIGTCLLLLGRESTLPVEAVLPGCTGTRWILVTEAAPLPHLVSPGTAERFELDFTDAEAGRRLAESVLRRYPELDAIIDLADVAGEAPRDALAELRDDPGRLGLAQGLLQGLLSRPAGRALRYLHVSSAEVLTGTRMAALMRSLAAEYSILSASTVDVEWTALDAERVLDFALAELSAPVLRPELRVRDAQPLVPRYEPVPVPPEASAPGRFGPFELDPDATYVITGGTGGIGLAAARRLRERGARKLAILGRRPIPPVAQWSTVDRLAGLAALRDEGATIATYSGELTDAESLGAFLSRVRVELGPIRGVLHCAGSVRHEPPAFVRKGVPEILDTWSPKGAGLLTLHRLLAADRPDFVVLFSSVSAVLPGLAVGLSDYASGNAVLDAYARLAGAQAPQTRYLSVAWGSWTGLGMGEVTSPRYRELGFGVLTEREGLDLLEDAMRYAPGSDIVAASMRSGAHDAWLPPVEAVEPPAEGKRYALAERITELLAAELMRPAAELGSHTPFTDLGVDSILMAGLVGRLDELTGAPLRPSVILEYPSIAELTDFLIGEYGDAIASRLGSTTTPIVHSPPSTAVSESRPAGLPIAVIGMSCRYPGAPDARSYWELLRSGECAVGEVPASRWSVLDLYSPQPRSGRSTSRWGGFLEGIEDFDPEYFGIAPDDAAHVDPLIRLFLEGVEYALRDAGYRTEDVAGRQVGVFVGSGTGNYGSRIAEPRRNTVTGLNQNFISAHAAQMYDLRGPNLVVDSACSSALTALHLALQALQLGDCDLAVVGGADLLLDETPYLKLSASGALSPDGVCRAFDASANGIVLGEGVGVTLLKPLDRALADGDRIDAVIEAAAINNDGRTMGLTTPNPKAQEQVVRAALDRARVAAGDLSYVEAHGTGTMIGDPMELQALTQVFRRDTDERGFCAIGSVKSNLGHLSMASGMASLHKVILALVNGVIPATLHCDRPNPRFSFETSPFYPAVATQPWQPAGGVRRAGVSSFGFGGTNCHVLLRELLPAERDRYRPNRVPLPPPQFRRARYWVENPSRIARPVPHPVAATRRPLLELRVDEPAGATNVRRVLELHEELS